MAIVTSTGPNSIKVVRNFGVTAADAGHMTSPSRCKAGKSALHCQVMCTMSTSVTGKAFYRRDAFFRKQWSEDIHLDIEGAVRSLR